MDVLARRVHSGMHGKVLVNIERERERRKNKASSAREKKRQNEVERPLDAVCGERSDRR